MKILRYFSRMDINLVLILILSTILVSIWFRDGNIMGGGEAGLPFYSPILQFKNFSSAWANYALGHPTNINIATKPTYWVLAELQQIGIPGFLIQAFFLWLTLIASGFGIYYLIREFFPQISKTIVFLSVPFYWFNPFSLVNVWNRFLNNFSVFYAFLPIALLLFIRGMRTKKYIYAILIGLFSLIFSYASSSVAFILILWLVLLYAAFFHLVFNKPGNKVFVVKFFVLAFSFWFAVNFWWINQVFSYLGDGGFAAVVATSFKSDTNYQTFYLLSQRLGNLIDLLRLKHASFFADTENMNWVGIYQFPLITLLEFLVTGIILLPIVIKRKQPGVLFMGGLFMLSIFFTKGNNPPLGEIFDKVLIHFSFLQLFRNPFEKIGFVLPLASASLFCLGVSLIINKCGVKLKKVVYSILFGWLFIVWGGPFWTSLVFTSPGIPTNKTDIGYQVIVPIYYQQAEDWLASQGSNFRLLFFPIGGEGITYSWPKGYSGVELSNQILPVTSVSFNTNIPFYNEVSASLERIFLTRENFSRIMDALNSKYIVLRSDIDWKNRGMRDPQMIQERLEELESKGDLKKVKQFGHLQLWEYLGWSDRTIYPAKKLVKAIGVSAIEDITNSEVKDLVLVNSVDALKEKGLIGSEIIRPTYKFGLGSKRVNTSVNISDEFMFPAVRILPSEYLYPAIILKEKIETSLIKDKNTLTLKRISLLGKRLNEAEIEAGKGHIKETEEVLNLYIKQLKEVLPDLSKISQVKGDYFLLQEDVYKIFLKHFDRINKIKDLLPQEKKEEALNLNNTLEKNLTDRGIIPYFGYLETADYPIRGRLVYQFNVEKDGSYEFLLDTASWNKYFKASLDKPFVFLVDKEVVSRQGTLASNQLVSYGFFNLAAGKHEIAWNTPDEVNLVESIGELNLKVDHGVVEKIFPINNLDPYSEYVLSLNYLIRKGIGVEVIVEQNNDSSKKGKIEPRYDKLLGPDAYDFEDKNFTAYFVPSTTADKAKMILRVKPWNNCEEIYRTKGKEKCLDENFRRPYDRTTEVLLSNVSFYKTITEIPVLRKETNPTSASLPKISYQKINAAEYKVNVEGAKEPFILVLSQLFDPAWKMYINGKEARKDHFLANAYANGWFVDKSGNYELTIKFIPQDLLAWGETISALNFMGGFVIVLWKLRSSRNEKN